MCISFDFMAALNCFYCCSGCRSGCCCCFM